MNIPDFLTRSSFFLNEENYNLISSTNITICGLGGIGGLAFLSLVRSGFKNFKLAENGIFDEPDLNRQALAFRSTIGLKKIDVYIKAALDINPDINIKKYPVGLTDDNLKELVKESDIFIRVIDHEKSNDVKTDCNKLLTEYKIPLFQAENLGVVTLMQNFENNIISPEKFWVMFKEKNVFDKFINSETLINMTRNNFDINHFPTTCIGANMSSLILASEIVSYTLRNTDTINRPIIFMPNFIMFNPLDFNITIMDITKI
jgi:tRNA threonylcarbamoyladenosine dehydratase